MSITPEQAEDVIVIAPTGAARPSPKPSVTVIEEDSEQSDPVSDADNAPHGMGEPDDPYSIDDVEPMPRAQKAVIAFVIAAIAFLAVYLLWYWNIF